MPTELSFSMLGEGLDIIGLTANNVFEMSGFPDLQKRILDSSDFKRQTWNTMNRAYLQIGFKLFKTKEFKRQTLFFIGFGFGNRFLLSNHYGERSETSIFKKSGNTYYLIDSIYTYDAFASISFGRIGSVSIGLEHTLLQWKLLSFRSGILFDYLLMSGANASQSEWERYNYSDFFEGEILIGEREKRTIPVKMHSLGFSVPLSFTCKLSNDKKVWRNLFLQYSIVYGYKFFRQNNIAEFEAKTDGTKLTLGYAFSF